MIRCLDVSSSKTDSLLINTDLEDLPMFKKLFLLEIVEYHWFFSSCFKAISSEELLQSQCSFKINRFS